MGSESPKDHMLLEVSETADSPGGEAFTLRDGEQSKVADQPCPWSFFQSRQTPSICPDLFVFHSVWRRERDGTRVQGPLASKSGRSLQIDLFFTGG